jgi:trehalose-phosphatase
MKSIFKEIMHPLIAWHSHGQRLLLLFDYDGTLTPIVPHPRLARLHPAVRRTLLNLNKRVRIEVGIISGREIDDLKAMVGLRGIYYVGTSGLQLDLCGTRITHPKADQMILLLARFRKPLRKIIKMFPGAWLEDKQLGLTVHYRNVHPNHIMDLRVWIEKIAVPFNGQLELQEGPMAVEITPKFGWNKATAVQLILEHIGDEDLLTLYAGDGPNDVAAFEALTSMGGICVGIGPDASQIAQYRLAGQTELLAFLARLDAEIAHTLRDDSLRSLVSSVVQHL